MGENNFQCPMILNTLIFLVIIIKNLISVFDFSIISLSNKIYRISIDYPIFKIRNKNFKMYIILNQKSIISIKQNK